MEVTSSDVYKKMITPVIWKIDFLVNMLGYGDGTRRGQGTKARTPVMKSMKFLAKEKTKA